MKFKTFKTIIEGLQDAHEIMDNMYEYIRPEIFEKHNRVISELLTVIYGEYVVSYILDEWLSGNTSPIRLTQDDGTVIETPVKTVHDLWKAMEALKEPEKFMEKQSINFGDMING